MKKFIVFLFVGGSATLLQYGIMILLVQLAHWPAVIATSIGYIVSSLFNYLLNYYATFKSDAEHRTAIIRFATVATIGLGWNSGIVYLLTKASWHYLLAQLVATVVVLLWNFFLHKLWTYKNAPKDIS